ncbi:hypothetical protein HII26_23260 [Paenibacillus aquistagni]|nr:hypothetical protein [Paenibacillus aquistagni]
MKFILKEQRFILSRCRIGRIMKEQGLVSAYTIAHYKPHKTAYNKATTANVLEREFD